VIDPASYATLVTFLRERSGLSLGPDKGYLLESRLKPLLKRHQLRDFATLADRLRHFPNNAPAHDVVEAMTTNETYFFREPMTFKHLAAVIRSLVRDPTQASKRIRIWSAACSTGQEVCSISMTLVESGIDFQTPDGYSVEILGTDIDERALARVQSGVYSAFEINRGLSVERLCAHFLHSGDGWQMRQPHSHLRYQRWNLLNDPMVLAPFDIVFCRYVLIYFDLATRRDVLRRIARVLRPCGVLYLGGMEGAVDDTSELVAIAGVPGAYRRR
jgi:chemotaxis protein methyltransferase CheR